MLKGTSKYMKDLRHSNKAVSEVVGTVLLLGMAVAIFSTIYISVLSTSLDAPEPNPIIVAKIEGKNIIFEHRGGKELSLETKILIDIENANDLTVGELLIDTNGDGQWNIGERLAYEFNYNISQLEADVISIDVGGNKIILQGTLDISPGCDLGIEIWVKESKEPEFMITATNFRSDINNITTDTEEATDIKIKITLPNDLKYNDYNSTTHGNYNNDKGIWSIDNLPVGDSATLKIVMKGSLDSGMIGTAKLKNSSPNDINPANDVASIEL